jgi:hypothetical protein
MEKEEVENLIARKVAEAKLEMSLKRQEIFVWVAGALLGLFGFLYPIWQSNKSSERTDSAIQSMNETVRDMLKEERSNANTQMEMINKAIDNLNGRTERSTERMQNQFKELAGNQLKKAKLECSYNGKALVGSVISLSDLLKPGSVLQVKNIGNGAANSPVTITLFGKDIPFQPLQNCTSISGTGSWNKLAVLSGDENAEQFDAEFVFQREDFGYVVLGPDQPFYFCFQFVLPQGQTLASLPKGKSYNMLVRLLYGETPYRVQFRVKVE